ncbi:Ankyrin repeat domain-containing protein 1 [Collichthys lucidus]|uniref:Ankyrin repeat domain-containing protein 1 n=1 Tax=Collichthys lucidus TaxID=240159 RepID=A0A4V6XZ15_COLLU|nr:Ankyrin repeat domain-containing protein 1 [Collichthys lucidus]
MKFSCCSVNHVVISERISWEDEGAELMPPYYVDEDDFFKACDRKQLLVIDRYLSTGGDVNAYDAFERTGLHRACSQGHTEVVTKLMEAGADIRHRDKEGDTPLHDAVRLNRSRIIQLLLLHGANTHLTNQDGRRPLDEALEWQNEAKTLIEQNNRK